MMDILIGVVATTVFFMLLEYSRRRQLPVRWWGWSLTSAGLLYVVFVIKIITAFLTEGSVKAAVVTGMLLGFFAIVWGVLLQRFIFRRRKESEKNS